MPTGKGADEQSGVVPERRRRSDAERNIEAIVQAGIQCLQKDPEASMTAIAQVAGVSRVTLYTHFPSRERLVIAALDRVLTEANKDLRDDALDRMPAAEALPRLVRAQWRSLNRHRSMFDAALRVLTLQQLKERHHHVLRRVETLIRRGQEEGTVRTDLPTGWLVTVFYSLLHIAADEVNASSLKQREAADILDATVSAVLTSGGPK